ncbi:HAD hydrolase-like protein [Streptomyces sp. NBC_00343]|uniref:HAD hydrolase-like protein n=1 Tax=Streptomyces sp. NBC_00343 TaxID=2975719 RepID=UPI003FA79A73
MALDRAGSPGRVWMVGDNAVADVAGAQALGIPAILVSPGQGDGLRPAVRRLLDGDVAGAGDGMGIPRRPRPQEEASRRSLRKASDLPLILVGADGFEPPTFAL